MSIIIPYLFFTSFAITIAVALNKKFDKILPFSFIIPTLILYFSGFTGNLKIGLYINIFASVLWIPIAIHKVINKKTNFKEIVENIFTVGFVIYSLLFIFVCIYHRFPLLTSGMNSAIGAQWRKKCTALIDFIVSMNLLFMFTKTTLHSSRF